MKFINIILALVVLAFAVSKKSRSHRRSHCNDDQYETAGFGCANKKAKNESCSKNEMCKSGHCDLTIKLCGVKRRRF